MRVEFCCSGGGFCLRVPHVGSRDMMRWAGYEGSGVKSMMGKSSGWVCIIGSSSEKEWIAAALTNQLFWF